MSENRATESAGAGAGSNQDSVGRVREVRFEQLSGGGAEVIVEYAGNKYRLLATKNGRLVLNK